MEKKIFRRSQKKDVLGRRVSGFHMYKYGLPYQNAAGHIFPRDIDLVERMLDAVEIYSDIHVVTSFRDGTLVNRYATGNVSSYHLYRGNADPTIEFTAEFSMDDWTAEEIAAGEKRNKEFRNRDFTPLEIAAINFGLHALLNRDKKK